MEQRTLEVTLISAEGLKDVNRLGKVRTFAVAWVDPSARQSTGVDKEGGTNPAWNETLSFTVPEASFHHPSARLTVEINHKGNLCGNTVLGTAHVPLAELLNDTYTNRNSGKTLFSYQVRRPSGRPQGSLNLSVRLGDKSVVDPSTRFAGDEPVMAYPAYPELVSGPPQFPRYPNSSSYLPQGHPSMPYYPPPVVVQPPPPPRRPGMGMGFGTGLLTGALGGLLVGDLVGDMAQNNGGFDGGFGF